MGHNRLDVRHTTVAIVAVEQPLHARRVPCRALPLVVRCAAPRSMCTWRVFVDSNVTAATDWTYGIEQYLHEALLQVRLAVGTWSCVLLGLGVRRTVYIYRAVYIYIERYYLHEAAH